MISFKNFVKKLKIFSRSVFAAAVARSHLVRGGLNGSNSETPDKKCIEDTSRAEGCLSMILSKDTRLFSTLYLQFFLQHTHCHSSSHPFTLKYQFDGIPRMECPAPSIHCRSDDSHTSLCNVQETERAKLLLGKWPVWYLLSRGSSDQTSRWRM